MAGDWIKVENVTPDKPELITMAGILGIDQDAVLGKLIRLWKWADEQTFFGDATRDGVSVTKLFIDQCTRVTGFADAMESVGWLTQLKSGLAFPNFDRHNGKTAKTRALTARRMRKLRDGGVTLTASQKAHLEKRERERDLNPPNPPLRAKGGTSVLPNGRRTRRPPKRSLADIAAEVLGIPPDDPK